MIKSDIDADDESLLGSMKAKNDEAGMDYMSLNIIII